MLASWRARIILLAAPVLLANYVGIIMQIQEARKANTLVGSLLQKQALVLGGTSGIGAGTAVRLAASGASVTIVGRNKNNAETILAEMKRVGHPQATHAFLQYDVSLLAEVKKSCAEFISTHTSLDYLVLSQGISTFQGRTPTVEGIDEKLALHYYSRVAFVKLLQPLLESTARMTPAADVRVLFVLSGGIHSPYHHVVSDPALEVNYSLKNAADAAGYYTDLAVDQLSSEVNSPVKFIHMAPGFIATAWGSGLPAPVRYLTRCMQFLFARSQEDCGEFVLRGLLGPFPNDRSTKGGFVILNQYAQETTLTNQHTPEAKAAVWKHTVDVLKANGIGNATNSF